MSQSSFGSIAILQEGSLFRRQTTGGSVWAPAASYRLIQDRSEAARLKTLERTQGMPPMV
jgi:hypothetical protein